MPHPTDSATEPAPASVAVVIHGPPAEAAVTVRGVRANTAFKGYTFYLVTDTAYPADALNRSAAVRTEDLLVFLPAGLTPLNPAWLTALVAAVEPDDVAAAVGSQPLAGGSPIGGLLVKRATFDLLGGFDADRHPRTGYVEDFLARLIGLGAACVSPSAACFTAPLALKRAS